MDGRKPRMSEIRLDFGRAQVLSGMHVAEDGTLTLFDENGVPAQPVRIEVGKTYARPAKSPKVLSRGVADPSSIQLDPNRVLLHYSFLFAVDTNTVSIHGTSVSMAVPVLVGEVVVNDTNWSAKLVPQAAFEFHDAREAPERIGWCELVHSLASHPAIRGPVGLIVDSELDALSSINARKQPILGNFFLPDNFELLYGCGDRGTVEFITNAAIADCDRTASRLLKRLRSEGFRGEYLTSESRPHGRFRYWEPPKGPLP